MKSYFKFLSNNKLYIVIEAVGLIVSLAFVILIGSYVRHQWNVSKGAPEWEHYYAIGTDYDMVEMAPKGLAWMIKENVPGVEHATMYSHLGFEPMLDGECLRDADITRVEPDFFEMFPVEWVVGDATSLAAGTLAVSEQIAHRFGPAQDMIGRPVVYGDTLVISAVYRSVGGPIFQQAGFLGVQEEKELGLGAGGGTTCLIDCSLPEDELIRTLDQVMDVHHRMTWRRDESRKFKNGSIERLDRLYFSDLNKGLMGFYKGNASQLRMLVAVVLLLLLSAVFNYINLNAALAGKRTKEMGVRAILGASRGRIIWGYLAESLLFISVCTLLACLLAEALAPVVTRYVEVKQGTRIVSVPFSLRWDIPTMVTIILAVLAVGLLAGWIPARLSSRFNPVQIVKGDYRFRSKRVFSKVFIVFQTALSVFMIAFSLVMERQFSHMIHRPVGADIENVYVQIRVSNAQVDELAGLPFVKEIGRSDGFPGQRYMGMSSYWKEKDKTVSLSVLQMDPAAFRMFGFEVVEDFHTPQGTGVWLSETGWNDLEMEPGQNTLPEGADFFWGSPQLAGELRDFVVTDAAHVEPDNWGAVVVKDDLQGHYVLVRVDGDRKAATKRLEEIYRKYSTEMFGFERWPESNGFIEDNLKKGLAEAEKYMRLIELFMLLAVLVSMLGLLAMSSFYASEQTRDVAVRKVFGGTVGGEVMHGVGKYMLLVAIACVIAVPFAVWLTGHYLEGFNYRISGYGWIFAVAVVITLVISFLAVLWQTLKAAKTNPAIELKKE